MWINMAMESSFSQFFVLSHPMPFSEASGIVQFPFQHTALKSCRVSRSP